MAAKQLAARPLIGKTERQLAEQMEQRKLGQESNNGLQPDSSGEDRFQGIARSDENSVGDGEGKAASTAAGSDSDKSDAAHEPLMRALTPATEGQTAKGQTAKGQTAEGQAAEGSAAMPAPPRSLRIPHQPANVRRRHRRSCAQVETRKEKCFAGGNGWQTGRLAIRKGRGEGSHRVLYPVSAGTGTCSSCPGR